MGTKEMVPRLRFSGFEGVWNKKTLGDIGKVKMCKRVFNNQTAPDEEIPFFKIGTFGKAPDAYISRSLFKSLKTRFSYPNKGDILISASGTLGRTVVYDGMEAYYQDSNIVWLENDQKLVPNEFLYYLYQIVKYDAEGSTIKRLYNSIILKARISVPKIEEQQKIASFLSSVDEKISQLEKKKTLLETYKRGIMQKIFSQELRFKDENGQEFPEWEEKKLSQEVKDFIVPMRDKPKDLSGEIPWCRIEDFNGIYLTKSKSNQGVSQETIDEMNLKVYPINTVLVSCSANLGFCSIVKTPLVSNQTFIGLVSGENLDPLFLYYLMRLSSRRLNTLSSGTTISYLSRKEFENFKVMLPDHIEQQKIASFLSSIDKKIEITSTQLEKTREFKKGLLQQMFV